MQESTWIRRYIVPLVRASGADQLRDDVAILSADPKTIVTMDTLVEDVHFLSADPLDTIGQKTVRVNVSDILAKGAEPREALLSIAWPAGRPEKDFALMMRGLADDLAAFGVSLIGGDLVETRGPLTLTLTLTGSCLGHGPVRRSGGRPGQVLMVNGEIGWGGLGLNAARVGGDDATALRFRVPRISSVGAAQAVADGAAASMDVSDGLLIDVSRLAEASGCGAILDIERVPLAAPTDRLRDIFAQCAAGDDYRILIAAEKDLSISGFFEIGQLTESPGMQIRHHGKIVNPPSMLGFEHGAHL